MSWEEWKEIANEGHEIGVHSMTHRSVVGLPTEELHLEIVGSKQIFTEKMGFSPMTFAYPYDKWDAVSQKLVLENYAIDRSDKSGAARFQDTWGGKEARGSNTTRQMNLLAEAVVRDGTWRVAEMHGIDDRVAPAICPGPSISAFTRIVSLEAMLDHVYGRGESLVPEERLHFLVEELRLNYEYLRDEIESFVDDGSKDRSLEILRTVLASDWFNDLWNEGSALTPDEMLNLADDYLNRHQTPTR